VLKTPNIDLIAVVDALRALLRGNPVCMPNRATLMTDACRRCTACAATAHRSHAIQHLHRCVARRLPPRPWARVIYRIFPIFRQLKAAARLGDQVLDAEFAEARKPAASEGPHDQASKQWEAGRDFKMRLPFYGFEHVDLHRAWRPGRRPLLRLAQVAAA
jgi:hypothetical protein